MTPLTKTIFLLGFFSVQARLGVTAALEKAAGWCSATSRHRYTHTHAGRFAEKEFLKMQWRKQNYFLINSNWLVHFTFVLAAVGAETKAASSTSSWGISSTPTPRPDQRCLSSNPDHVPEQVELSPLNNLYCCRVFNLKCFEATVVIWRCVNKIELNFSAEHGVQYWPPKASLNKCFIYVFIYSLIFLKASWSPSLLPSLILGVVLLWSTPCKV